VINLGGSFSSANLLSNVTRAGGTINLTGTVNNAGNHMVFTATTGDFNLAAGTINGGSISSSGGNLRLSAGSSRFINVQYNGVLTLDTSSSRLGISGNSSINGTVNLSGSSTVLGLFDTTTAPTTTYNLDGSSAYVSVEGNGTVTLPAGATVRGGNGGGIWYGFISGGINSAMVNNGLIQADLPAASFTVFPSGNNNFINNGTMSAINGSTLTISAATWSNSGNINATNSALNFSSNWSSTGSVSINNSTLTLGGTFSTSSLSNINRTGGAVRVSGQWNNAGSGFTFNASTGDWLLVGGTISGGSINLSGGALRYTSTGGRLHNVTFNSTLNLDQLGAALGISGATVITGTVNLSGSNANLSFFDTITAPSTTYHLDGNGAYLYTTGAGTNTLTFPAGTTIRGGNNGGIWYGFAGGINNTVVNNGTIQADINNGTFNIFPSGNNTFVNNGTLIATNGAKLVVNQLSGNLNTVKLNGVGNVVRVNGTYNINQPISVLNRATLNFQGLWTLNADIDASGRIAFDYPTAGPSPLATIRSKIITGRNGGLWNGPGIFSTAAAVTPNTAVGYGEASAALGALGGVFSGEVVDGTAILVRWTYIGDADLDGDVDIGDLGKLASNWQTAAEWTGGDFDYNGTINVNDLGLLASSWQVGVGNPLGPSLADALAELGLPTVAVPEPTSAVLLAGLTVCSAAPRWRKRSG
jgi:hypothetical protein